MSIDTSDKSPNIEERFLQPKGWRWHHFQHKDRILRFGMLPVKDGIVAKATIICLPGLSEFGEKYYETARWAQDNDFSFWVLDWAGQGRSSRPFSNRQKRHSKTYQDDIDDLHYFIMKYVRYASVAPDVGRIPLSMLAHSMGGNIGMHYLAQHPGVFECAIFSAPMMGIKALTALPASVALVLSGCLKILFGSFYVFGGGDWNGKKAPLSSDPVRNKILNQWFERDPELRTGDVTFGWVFAGLRSCFQLQNKKLLSSIQTHCTFAKAGQDQLVDNKAIERVAQRVQNGKMLELPDSQHEILMEIDPIRNEFLDAFYRSIKENIIDNPEALKTF